jgi:hypothetical protein
MSDSEEKILMPNEGTNVSNDILSDETFLMFMKLMKGLPSDRLYQ